MNNEKSEREIKESIIFTIAKKKKERERIKYLRINLPKETKDLNYKTKRPKTIRHSWKKSKITQTDGEIYYVLRLEDSILWKWLYYPKLSTDSVQYL